MSAPPEGTVIARFVAWLASEASGHVTGRVFEIKGGGLSLYDSQRPTVQLDKTPAGPAPS